MNADMKFSPKFLFRYGIWAELSNLFRMLSELLLIVVWLISLTMMQTGWNQGFIVLGVIYFGTYFLSRFLNYLNWKMIIQRILFLGWVVLVVAFSSSTLLFSHIELKLWEFLRQIFQQDLTSETVFGFWILLFSMVIILRGVQVARYPVSARELASGLRVNLLLFAIYAAIFGKDQVIVFFPSFLVFMLFSLAGMSLARISDLSDSFGSRLPGFTPQWAVGIGLAAVVVVFLGLAASWIFNLDVAQFLGRGLLVLLQLVFGAIVLIMSPVLLAVVSAVRFLLQLLAPNLAQILEPADLDLGNQMLDDLQSQVTDATRTDPRLFVMIGVLVLIVVLTIIQLRWKPFERFSRGEEDSSNLEINFRLPKTLKNIFPNRLRRRRRRSAKSLIAAARIRYTYAQLMDLCDRLGKPRPRSLTPTEFLPRMDSLFPPYHAELELITQAYNKVRYGELPETSKDIEDVLEAWKKISLFGKEIIDERNKNLRRTDSR